MERPWLDRSLPDDLTSMHTMLTHEELQYLSWLTATQFEGFGAIVDLGPWLGSSSAALAHGLRESGRSDVVLALDRYEWERSYMEAHVAADLPDGASFLPLFHENVGGYGRWIRPEKQDLTSYRWPGGPIEILFVDAAKSWKLTNSILQSFGAHLVPGKSRVVLQDFRFYPNYYLPLIFDGRPDLWRESEGMLKGTTVTFKPLKAVDGPTGVHACYNDDAFPPAAAEQIFRARIAREESGNAWLMRASYLRKCVLDGAEEEARRMRKELGNVPEQLAPIEAVGTAFIDRGWESMGNGDWAAALRHAQRACDKDRSSAALQLLALASIRLRDLDAAQEFVDELRRMDSNPVIALIQSEVWTNRGQNAQAEQHVLEMLRSSDNHTELVWTWAIGQLTYIWRATNGIERARALSAEFAARKPESASIWALRGRIELTAGNTAGAREHLATAQRFDASLPIVKQLQDELAARS